MEGAKWSMVKQNVRSLNFLKSEKTDIQKIFDGKMQEFDTVEGPMTDDKIQNFVNDFLNHSIRVWECLEYERGEAVNDDTME